MTQKTTKLVFDRKKWTSGSLSEGPPGQESFCALGFYMNQIGFNARRLRNMGGPSSIAVTPQMTYEAFAQKLVDAGAEWLVCPSIRNGVMTGFRTSAAAYKIIDANDGLKNQSQLREETLRRLFAEHGIEIEFK